HRDAGVADGRTDRRDERPCLLPARWCRHRRAQRAGRRNPGRTGCGLRALGIAGILIVPAPPGTGLPAPGDMCEGIRGSRLAVALERLAGGTLVAERSPPEWHAVTRCRSRPAAHGYAAAGTAV